MKKIKIYTNGKRYIKFFSETEIEKDKDGIYEEINKIINDNLFLEKINIMINNNIITIDEIVDYFKEILEFNLIKNTKKI
jgi:hypothetical protein